METKVWSGSPPASCDVCGGTINDEFIDGKTRGGPWASMCPPCHRANGVGLGTGKGQRYVRRETEWVQPAKGGAK